MRASDERVAPSAEDRRLRRALGWGLLVGGTGLAALVLAAMLWLLAGG